VVDARFAPREVGRPPPVCWYVAGVALLLLSKNGLSGFAGGPGLDYFSLRWWPRG
jgi:hypothetical protein